MSDQRKVNLRRLADIQEKRIQQKTRKLDGSSRKTINSGAFAGDPADVSLSQYLIDAKTLVNEQMTQSVDRRWLSKVKEEAFSKGKRGGIIMIDFGCGQDCVVTEFNDWLEVVQERDDTEKKLKAVKDHVAEAIRTGEGWEVAIKCISHILNK